MPKEKGQPPPNNDWFKWDWSWAPADDPSFSGPRVKRIQLDEADHLCLDVNGAQVYRSPEAIKLGVTYRVKVDGERLEVTEA